MNRVNSVNKCVSVMIVLGLVGSVFTMLVPNAGASFTNEPSVWAVADYIGPSFANAAEMDIGMLNITINNSVAAPDTLNYINVTVLNASNVVSATIWRETNGNGIFDGFSGDTFIKETSVTYQSGNIGYFNLTSLGVAVGPSSNVSLYLALNLTASPIHGDYVSTLVEPYQINMTNAGQGNSTALNPQNGFIIDNKLRAEADYIGPQWVKGGDKDIGMLNVTIVNTAYNDDTLEWINITIWNSYNIQNATLWLEANANGMFDGLLGDVFLAENLAPYEVGIMGYFNFTSLGVNIPALSNTSIYIALNLTDDPTHNDYVNVSIEPYQIYMTNAGYGNDTLLDPQEGFIIDNKLWVMEDYIGPMYAKANQLDIGMLNITINNTLYSNDILEWLNVSVLNSSSVQKVTIWKETNDNGIFDGISGDSFISETAVTYEVGNMGYFNLTSLGVTVVNSGETYLYIALNLTSTPIHNHYVNVSIQPYNINFQNAGLRNSTLLDPWDGFIVDTQLPEIVRVFTTDPDGDGKVENATIIFSEPILDSSIVVSKFELDGIACVSFDTLGTPNDNEIEVTITGGINGTDVKDLTFTPGLSETTDLAGNNLSAAGSGDIVEIDDAKPVVLSAETRDQDSNGKIDAYVLLFSEDISVLSAFFDLISIDGYVVDKVNSFQSGPNETTLVLIEGVNFDTNATPEINYPAGYANLLDNATSDTIDIVVGDLNDDTLDDIAVLSQNSGSIFIYYQGSSGSFEGRRDILLNITNGRLAMGDVNFDNVKDIVCTDYDNDKLAVFIQKPDTTFYDKVEYNTSDGPLGVAIGDVDNDLRNDVVVTNYLSGNISVFIQNNGDTLDPKVDYQSNLGPASVAIGDVSNDGRDDVLVVNRLTGNLSVFYQNAGNTLDAKLDYNTGSGPMDVAVGDLNDDTYLDAVVTNYNDNNVSVYFQSGGLLTTLAFFETDIGPEDVIITDFNNDLLNDIICTNPSNNSISYLPGTTGGVFNDLKLYETTYPARGLAGCDLNTDGYWDFVYTQPEGKIFTVVEQVLKYGTIDSRLEYLTQDQPRKIASGDVNNDGIDDLVVTNWNTDTITVYYRAANGRINDRVDLYAGNQPWYVKIGDVNNDTRNDVVVTTYGNNQISIFYQNTGGKLNSRVTYATPSYPRGLDLGDINGDGLTDIVFGYVYSYYYFSVFKQDGAGGLLPRQDISTPYYYVYDVAVGDVNHDGRNDVAAVYYYNSRVTVHLQNAGGTLDPSVEYATPSNPTSVEIGDVNNDGWDDVVVGSNANYISVFISNIAGSLYGKVDYSSNWDPYDLKIGDINNDGRYDVVVASYNGDRVLIFNQNTLGTLDPYQQFWVGDDIWGVEILDYNLDSLNDIAATVLNEDKFVILFQGESIGFDNRVSIYTGDNPRGVDAGDVNNDGRYDIVVCNMYDDTISVFIQDANGGLLSPVTYSTGDYPYYVAIGDVNGDGLNDVVATNYYNEYLPGYGWTYTINVYLQNAGGTLNPRISYLAYSYPWYVAIGDINNDGWNDVVVTSDSGNDWVMVYEQNPSTHVLNSYVLYKTGYGPKGIAIGDLNDDGKNDVAIVNQYDDTVSVFIQNAGGSLDPKQDYTTGDYPHEVAIADVNEDGLNDMIVTNSDTNTISKLTQNVFNFFDPRTDYTTGYYPYGLVIADVTNDGNNEILTSSTSNEFVSVHYESLPGEYSDRTDIRVGTNPYDLAVGDFNNDGLNDIVVTEASPDTISIIYQQIYYGGDMNEVNYPMGRNSLSQISNPDINEQDKSAPVYVDAITGDSQTGNSSDTTKIVALFSEDLNGASVNIDGSDFSISGGVIITAASETQPGIVTLTISPINTSDTPTLSLMGTIMDVNGVAVAPKSNIARDGLRPVIISAVTDDTDLNGFIDQYYLIFSEPVQGTFDGTGFSLADGYIVDTSTSTQISPTEMVLGIIEKTSYDTGLTPDIIYAIPPGDIRDNNGNYLLIANVVEDDGAIPAVPEFYIASIYETSPNLYSPDNETLYYNNTALLNSTFQLLIEAEDNGNLDYATGSDAFGNTSVIDNTENTGGTQWEYELDYTIDNGETGTLITVTVFDNDINYGTKTINLILDNDSPVTNLYTGTGTYYVVEWSSIGFTTSDATGILGISYKIDSGSWTDYSGEFNLMGYSSGWHTIYYNSTDNVNNKEITKSTNLFIAEDWTGGVASYGVHQDKAILGNNLTISSDLTFINVTLFMNCTSNTVPTWINVTSTGIFNLTESMILSINPGYNYRFIVDGTMNMGTTHVENLWGDSNNNLGGIEIYKDTVKINDSYINDAMVYAVLVQGSSPIIDNNQIWNAPIGINARDGAAPLITNNIITDTSTFGIHLINCSSVIIDYNTLSNLNSGTGIHLENMDLTGDVFITNNTLENNVHTGIRINNTQGAQNIYIDNNTLKSDTNGLLMENNAGMLHITDNWFDGITFGLWMDGAISPLIEDNTFTNCDFGMNLTDITGGSTIITNTLNNCAKTGITIENSGSFDIKDNTFTNVGWEALRIFQSTGTFNVENNNVNNGIWGGIWTYFNANSSNINIINNSFTATWFPIYIDEHSDNVLIQGNTLLGSIEGGIWIEKDPDTASDTVTIMNNEIRGTIQGGGPGDGIYLKSVNTVLINNNDIIGGASNGISINTGGTSWFSITIENNLIKNNLGNGIYSTDPAFNPTGTVIDNIFLNNGNYGFYSTYPVTDWTFNDATTFSGNSLYLGGPDFDIVVGSGGNLVLNDFTFQGNDLTIENSGDLAAYNTIFTDMNDLTVLGSIMLSSCDIDTIDKVVLDDPGSAVFISTPIHDNNQYGLYVTNTNIVLPDLEIYSNMLYGIYIVNANPTVQDSYIYWNNNGIYLDNFNGAISGNHIYSNSFYGIYGINSGGTISNNDIYSNTAGVLLDVCGNMVISNNNGIRNNNGNGLEISNSVAITISGNQVNYNINHGILITDSSDIVVGNSNTINYNRNIGIYIDPSNNITVKNNTINSGYNGVIGLYASDSDVLVENNYIWQNNQEGVKIVYTSGEIRFNDIGWNLGNGITNVLDQGTYIHDNYLHHNGDSPPNLPPSITGGYITPVTAYYNSVLTANTLGWSDPEGAPESIFNHLYQWQINVSGTWTNIGGATGITLSWGFVGGDEIRCVITPGDGDDWGNPINSDSITISNSPPLITSVTLSPDPPYHTQPITTSPTGFWDPDGDTTQVYYYAWYNQSGLISGVTTSYLPSSYTSPDDQVYCIVTPSDGMDNGIPVQSNTVIVILYVDPGANPDSDGDGYSDVIDIFPSDPNEWFDNDFDGIGNNADTDDDNDGYNDTAEIKAGSNPLDFDSQPADFDGDYLPDGDETNSNLTWMDPDDDNDGFTDTDEIAAGTDPYDPNHYPGSPNRPPSIDSVLILPDIPYDNQVLSAIPIGFSDPDGDTTQVYYYQWYKNGAPIPGATPSILAPTNFAQNDIIYVKVMPSDGTDNGTNVSSLSVIIIHYTGQTVDDYDGDGVVDAQDDFPYDPTQWSDTDGDGLGDNQTGTNPDPDIDGDGVLNGVDAFPYNQYEWDDTDSDGIGDNTDPDIDGDGVLNGADDFPYDNTEWSDTDSDGTGDNTDPDIDGDGVPNGSDDFPYNPNEYRDSDGDGFGDNIDQDDDNDGRLDVNDAFPNDPTQWKDTDGDGLGDNQTGNNPDPDIDNDGVLNGVDAFPNNPNEWSDTDSDGIGDNSDIDIDGDGVLNGADDFPYDGSEWTDSDGDGTGNNADPDDDNDGFSDVNETAAGSNPLDFNSQPDDFDNDYIPDVVDTDDDNDGFSDTSEQENSTNQFDPLHYPGSPNRPPSIDSVTLLPSPPYDNQVLSAIPMGFSDPDGDTTQVYYYQWYKNGAPIPGATSSTLPPVNFAADDIIYVEVQPSDGKDNGTNVTSLSVVIIHYEGQTIDDYDGDGVVDAQDDFPYDPTQWSDMDGDGLGDNQTGNNPDPDIDGDGVLNGADAFPYNSNEWDDTDSDGIGDNTDPDIDGDGVLNGADDFPYDNTEWKDTDSDGTGDNTDPDIDGDGVLNGADAFPDNSNEWDDTDSDGIGDNSDQDIDGDGVLNGADDFPYDNTEWKDTDSDGTGDNTDPDIDGDSVPNGSDAFPYDPTEYLDSDSDGFGDNIDQDDDNDGRLDVNDAFPNDPTQWKDTDGDGLGDNQTGNNPDPDIDGDGVLNGVDAFPKNANEWEDTDSDGIGDNTDPDIDGDGVLNGADDFPYDNTEWKDTDSDGVGNNADPDDDNDGYIDVDETAAGSNPLDFDSTPEDFDGDYNPDVLDPDDDNDGHTDADEITAGTDPFDDESYPGAPNRPPSISSVLLNPNPPYDNQPIVATPVGFSDPDGDTNQVYYYEWYNQGGMITGADTSILMPSYFKMDDLIYATVTPSDGADNGTPVNTLSVLVLHYTEPGTEPPDYDGDNVVDAQDAFPYDPTQWSDFDGDGLGDNPAGSNPDLDIDNDEVPNTIDEFPYDVYEWNDTDSDGIGDNSDSDIDGDGALNEVDAFPFNSTETKDTDSDGIGNNADSDDDGDGYDDTVDEFPLDPLEWEDADSDGLGDNSDQDIDGDGVLNSADDFPYDGTESVDLDSDGMGDNADTDRDGDGITNTEDAFPDNENEWTDTDSDGIGDNSDSDIDGDSALNSVDAFPFDSSESKDTDSDGTGDNSDLDRDGDGRSNTNDAFPDDKNEQTDTDSDGLGDNSDSDIDGDSVLNGADAFPFDNTESKDTDSDGIGNIEDTDDDGDGIADSQDSQPLIPNLEAKAAEKGVASDTLIALISILGVVLVIMIVILLFTSRKGKGSYEGLDEAAITKKEPEETPDMLAEMEEEIEEEYGSDEETVEEI